MKNIWNDIVPARCELCRNEIISRFVDGKVKSEFGGGWCCMCPTCHQKSGFGYGVGKGQEYTQQGDQFVKTRG